MKISSLKPAFVAFIPEELEDGVIYISEQYATVTHRCCCGCGEEVVTPLTPTEWTLTNDDGLVTLYPSVGNWGFKCKSHYWIRKNRVIDAGPMPQAWIDRGRQYDRKLKEAYYRGDKADQKPAVRAPTPLESPRLSLIARIKNFVHWLFNP